MISANNLCHICKNMWWLSSWKQVKIEDNKKKDKSDFNVFIELWLTRNCCWLILVAWACGEVQLLASNNNINIMNSSHGKLIVSSKSSQRQKIVWPQVIFYWFCQKIQPQEIHQLDASMHSYFWKNGPVARMAANSLSKEKRKWANYCSGSRRTNCTL